jgi:hypothetical protein
MIRRGSRGYRRSVDTQRAAEIQVVLEGVPLPATRQMLVDYALQQDASFAGDLRRLPDGEYRRLDDVGAALLDTRPAPRAAQRLPRPESGAPPGGSAYTATPSEDTETGRVRRDAPPNNPPAKALDQQTRTQKRQEARQKG